MAAHMQQLTLGPMVMTTLEPAPARTSLSGVGFTTSSMPARKGEAEIVSDY